MPEWTVLEGDCIEVMRQMDEASVDAVVCDPPYFLRFMGRKWDHSPTPKQQQVQHEAWAREAFRVLKPGGHMLAFGGTRTYHRLACAVEDAGFEIRDMVEWFYGSGFPKSLNVGKAIDKIQDWSLVERISEEIKRARRDSGWSLQETGEQMMGATSGQYGKWYHRGGFKFFETGRTLPSRPEWHHLRHLLPIADEFQVLYEEAEREVVGRHEGVPGLTDDKGWNTGPFSRGEAGNITAPATDEAKQWDGWGSALKPAHEPVVLARKPLAESSIARNVLEHGTGALNIDASRIGSEQISQHGRSDSENRSMSGQNYAEPAGRSWSGRFPANLIFSHHPDCVRIGERRIKGTGPGYGGGFKDGKYSGNAGRGEYSRTSFEGYADESGMETVAEYRCAPGCPVAALDAQSGASKDSFRRSKGRALPGNGGTLGHMEEIEHQRGHGDSGGASRFFKTFGGGEDECMDSVAGGGGEPGNNSRICGSCSLDSEALVLNEHLGSEPGFAYIPKSSRAERNAGLEGMPKHQASVGNKEAAGRDGSKPGNALPGGARDRVERGLAPTMPRANNHPTVKPIALMRYLCRLITPPEGTVLDPFAGSGSTGCAAVLEGFDFIGIEKESEYVEIARRRIAHWSLPEYERARAKPIKVRNTYGFKITDVERRCPEHGESIPSGSTTYKCGCEKVWYKVDPEVKELEDLTLFPDF